MPYTHVLDLAETGFIKPHVDSSRVRSYGLYFDQLKYEWFKFCGSTVAVMSLLSPSVARFRLEKDRTQVVDALINRRSLYIMK